MRKVGLVEGQLGGSRKGKKKSGGKEHGIFEGGDTLFRTIYKTGKREALAVGLRQKECSLTLKGGGFISGGSRLFRGGG